MNKLNIKLSIVFGVLSFLISIGIGTYINTITTKQLEKNAGESLLKIAMNTADILDREMLERYREMRFDSTLPTMVNENSTKEQRRALIQKIKNNYNHHEWIGYALPDGTVDVGSNNYLEGKNVKGRPWHPAGLKGPYIGDVHDALLLAKLLPNVSGEAIYFSDVAFPVKNANGKVLGVLCTHLTWQWTRDMIRSIQKEHGVEIFLLSKDGLILVGPNNTERKELKDIHKNIYDTFKDSGSMYKILSWGDEINYLTAHTVSKGFDEYKGFGWKVIVRKPINEAFKESVYNTQNIMIASIIIAILGSIVGMLLSHKIAAPLERLTSKVVDLQHGKDVKFDVDSSTYEIQTLEKALKEFHTSLEHESKFKEIAEEKVKISLQVFEQSIEGILITDKENKIILTNKSFTDITGYTQDEVYGKNPKILGAENSTTDYKGLWDTLITKGKWEGNIQNKRKDGTFYKEHLKITTLKDEKGEIVYYLATFNSSF